MLVLVFALALSLVLVLALVLAPGLLRSDRRVPRRATRDGIASSSDARISLLPAPAP